MLKLIIPGIRLVGLCMLLPEGIVIEPLPLNMGLGLNVVIIGLLNNPLPVTSPCRVNPVFKRVFNRSFALEEKMLD